MNRLNKYNDFRNNKLKEISLLDGDSMVNNNEFQKYQKEYGNILNTLKINIHYPSTFKLSTSSLFILIKNIIDADDSINIESSIENVVLVTICAISLLVKEDKDNTSRLVGYAEQKGIDDKTINRIMRCIQSIKRIFKDVAKNFGKNIDLVIDMLSYTELFVPFVNVLLSIVKNNLIDINLISSETFKGIEDDDMKYKMIVNRIFHKLLIMVNNTNKFQNVKNSNVLRVNDEFKSPMYKNDRIQM